MVRELLHHGRVVVRRHAAIGQAADGGFGQLPPLGIAEPAVRLVHLPKKCLQLHHRVKRRRLARIGLDALQRGIGQAGGVVVKQQAHDAALELRLEKP